MIFSLSERVSDPLNFEVPSTDIFCFFHSQNAIKVPALFWLLAITSSLRLKQNVLILEENLAETPLLNTSQRWQVGEHFLWLAPRAASVLLEAHFINSISYKSAKELLKTFK